MFGSILFASVIISVAFGQDCSSPPPRVRPDECCPGLPQYMTKEMMEECNANGPPTCEVSTCVMNKKNLLNDDGSLDAAAIRSFTKNGVSGELASAVETTIQTCITEASDDSCPSLGFSKCFVHNFLKNCPESIWINSADCSAAKQHFQNCKPMSRP